MFGTMNHWFAPEFGGRRREAGGGDYGFVPIASACINCRAFVDFHHALFSLVGWGENLFRGRDAMPGGDTNSLGAEITTCLGVVAMSVSG